MTGGLAASTSHELQCTSCGATLALARGERTAVCPYCDTPTVVDRPPGAALPSPAFALGFVVDAARASEAVRAWVRKGGLFARSAFKAAAVEKTRGVYVPAWLYGAVAHSRWSARIGENYTETETYTTTNAQGKTETRTRTVTKTEWHSLSGVWRGRVSDVLITASSGLGNEELEAIEPFDLRALRRYSPALVAGWITEEASITGAAATELARGEAEAQVARRLAAFMPGDGHTDLQHTTTYEDEAFDLVLLPVWVFSARWHPDLPAVRVLVNGQTGEVQGQIPRSPLKIALAVLLVLGAVVAAVLYFGSAR